MLNILFKLYRLVFARRLFARLNLTLFHLSLSGLGILNHENDVVSGERFVVEKILPQLIQNPNPIFLDVGANVGKYTTLLQSNFPNAKIHAVEPHPITFSSLVNNVSLKNVKTHNIALGNAQGKFSLYDRADLKSSCHASLYEDIFTEIYRDQKVVKYEVTIDSLDNFASKEAINQIDYLKIDTEGNELEVLNGAANLLNNHKIGIIQFEFNSLNIVSRAFFRDFRKLLKNYFLYRLLPKSLLPLGDNPLETELFAFQNILAVLKSSTQKRYK